MADNPARHSLLILPYPAVVAGDRFREMYYWDSYFVIQGLLVSGMKETARVSHCGPLHLSQLHLLPIVHSQSSAPLGRAAQSALFVRAEHGGEPDLLTAGAWPRPQWRKDLLPQSQVPSPQRGTSHTPSL